MISPRPSTALLVFDLDGTLVDSRRDLADSANALLESYGAQALDEPAVARMVGDGAATLVRRVLAARGLAPDLEDALQRFLACYDERLLEHTQPYPGIREALRALARWARLAVLTNKPARATGRILEGLDLRAAFEWVIGGDTALPRKPDPAGLQRLMRDAAASAGHTVMIGDSLVDLRTAHQAGTRACLARYGFGFEHCPADAFRGDDLFVDRASDLPAVLERALRPAAGPARP